MTRGGAAAMVQLRDWAFGNAASFFPEWPRRRFCAMRREIKIKAKFGEMQPAVMVLSRRFHSVFVWFPDDTVYIASQPSLPLMF
jgi:hypothetical protein